MDFLRSPRQATEIFGLDGTGAARPKNLFVVRFNRASGSNGALDWTGGLSFVVRRVDRPSVSPQTETLNQYNRKRVIHTGYKTSPVRIEFVDTADSLAMKMWDEYTRYYFGDFAQTRDNYAYDITTSGAMLDNGSGYGYVPRVSQTDSADLNSQFFFSRISIFQVFGGYYTQCDLINPKITTFDPDDLDYENSGLASISATIEYEALHYANGGGPVPINSNMQESPAAELGSKFHGHHLEVSSTILDYGFGTLLENVASGSLDVGQALRRYIQDTTRSITRSERSSGSLQVFGDYDFGNYDAANRGSGGAVLGTAAIAADEYDAVRGKALAAVGKAGASYGATVIAANLLEASANGFAADRASEQITKGTHGVRLSSDGYAYINEKSDGRSLIGIKRGSGTSSLRSGDLVRWHGPRIGVAEKDATLLSDGNSLDPGTT